MSFGHYFDIIIKKKCSPFNQGIIKQSIMFINKVIIPMTELSDPSSYFPLKPNGKPKLNCLRSILRKGERKFA